ncbi:MAG: hypothetical protein GY862_18655 [Gammaproteobacteria bacterium]|nr:hypothetical protein [Gammaproteobacteria bacterium]
MREAHRLTHGQPMLLQMTGSAIINAFNEAYYRGELRGRYVSLDDLRRAADAVVREESNSAFESHWEHASTPMRQLLSCMAWAMPEGGRDRLYVEEISAALQEKQFKQDMESVGKLLRQLVEEEILCQQQGTYTFVVQLYQRWLSWRQPPASLRGLR